MSYQNQQKFVSKPAPQLCIKCREMFGHQTFSMMCSKCFKTQKLQTELQEKKNNAQLPTINAKISTQVQQKQKQQKIQTNLIANLPRRETAQSVQNKTQRQRTREKQQKKTQNKCFTCSKKTGMLGYECRHCVNNFCKFHRLPQDHQCGADFIEAGKKALTAANPELKARKIEGIDN